MIMPRKKVSIDLTQVEWKDVEEALGVGLEVTAGEKAALLSKDEETGAFTCIVKIPKGHQTTYPESHTTEEEYFLLEGDGLWDGAEIEAPHYVYLPAHSVHGPARSKDGALLLVTKSGPLDVIYHKYLTLRNPIDGMASA
jgi:hypothetical protein